MGRLAREERRVVRRAARELEDVNPHLSEDLVDLLTCKPLPSPDEVPDLVEEVVGAPIAFTRGNPPSEKYAIARTVVAERDRLKVWWMFHQRPLEGWTPREIVREWGEDPGEILNGVRRIISRLQRHRLLEIHGERTLPGRNHSESVRRFSQPVREYMGVGS